LLGRVFEDYEDDPGHALTTVVSHAFWLRHFNGDPHVLGKPVTLDSYHRRTYTVVGVMPARFDMPDRADLWLPMGDAEVRPNGHAGAGTRCCPWLQVFARLQPGVTARQAQAEMDLIAARIAQAHPDVNLGNGALVVMLQAHMVEEVKTALLLLFGAVGCVLLIACVNVANLQLAKAAARSRDIGIRIALGAAGWRIARQLLIENLLLSIGGGIFGLLLATWAIGLANVLPIRLPHAEPIRIDLAVLAFSTIVSVSSGLAFGMAPAWHASHVRPQDALKLSSTGASANRVQARMRAALVVSEVAVALTLLAGASLLVRSLVRLEHVNLGFRPERLLVADIDTTSTAFDGPGPSQTFFDQLTPRVASIPGVRAVTGNLAAPMTDAEASVRGFETPVTREGQPFRSGAETPHVDRTAVMPGYFQALEIPLLRGRDFTSDDREGRPYVAIVSATMASQLWPGENPIGKRLSPMTREDIERRRGLGGSPESIYVWTEVVGVVADVRHAGLAGASRPLLYVPYRQTNWHNAQLIVRTSGDPLALAATVRAEVGAVNRNAIVTRVQTMEAAIGDSIARPRMATLLVGAFSTVGVLLAALGLYGIMAHGVVQRTREIGIRVALGATHGDVSWLILRQGFIVTLAGILIGLLGVTLTARVLGTLLYATSPVDPLALAIAILLLMAAALSAAYIPARRATGVDPIVALRDE